MNAAESKNLATVLKMLGGSSPAEECYQDLKEPGDFAKFLSCEQKEKVSCPSNKGRVLEDTRGHVYYFKRTINKKNKFGKACRCGVWICRHYRRLYCCCAVYTFGDTIVSSNGPHNHDPITKETEENSKQQRLDQSRRANFKIPTALKNKIRRHNSGPKVDSIKRSVQRAREQLNSKRKRRCAKKRILDSKGVVKKEESVLVVKKCDCESEETKPLVKVEVPPKEALVKPLLPAVIKAEESTVAMDTTPATPATILPAPVTPPPTVLPTPPAPPTEKKDTLNEILEILNDISKNSSHSYQALCSQLLSEYMTGQGSEQTPATSPKKRGTISSITIPLQDFPVHCPAMSTPAPLPPSSTTLLTSSSLRSSTQPSTSHVSVSSASEKTITTEAPLRPPNSESPEISVISSTSTARPYVKSAPPPNVTIAYNKEPSKPTVNPDLRPVINIPSFFDTPNPISPAPAVSASAPVAMPTVVSEPGCVTSLPQQPVTSSRVKSPELPPRGEYNILSDMTCLENLLDILKENSPIRDAGAQRCTCKTMLRCNLHDIGPGKKRQAPIKPRKVLTRNDDAPKPARKKYCYRGSKKPYKFIPETFKDCQLPANEDTVIGTAGHASSTSVVTNTTTTKKGRGGRRSRGVKPVNLPPPPPPPPVSSVPHAPTVMPSGVGLTPISPAPEPRGNNPGNTINLVPVTSVSGPSFENSKLLKAVPIGNGLYRLEEAHESEMQAGALSKPIFTTDFGLNNTGMLTSPSGPLSTGNVPFSPTLAPMFNPALRNSNKPLTVIEHHPTSSLADSRAAVSLVSQAQVLTTQALTTQATSSSAANIMSSDVTHQLNSLLTSVLSSINNNMSNNSNTANNLSSRTDSVPLMIPASAAGGDENVSSTLVNQLIERLLSVDSAGSEEKLMEAVSSNLSGITQH